MSKEKVGIYAIAKAGKTWSVVFCEIDKAEAFVAGIMRIRKIREKLLVWKEGQTETHRLDLLMLRSGRVLLLYRGAMESKS